MSDEVEVHRKNKGIPRKGGNVRWGILVTTHAADAQLGSLDQVILIMA